MGRLLLLVPIVAAACAQKVDSGYAGEYAVSAITASPTCDGTGDAQPIPSDQAFFELTDDTEYGEPMVAWHVCASSSSCNPGRDLSLSFLQDGDGWETQASTASIQGLPTLCLVAYGSNDLTRISPTQIQVTRSYYTDVLVVSSADDCTVLLTNKNKGTIPCVGSVVTIASTTTPATN